MSRRRLGAACVAAVATGAASAASWNPFMIASPTGFPLGRSVRAPGHVATLIQALEPYVPSLHRNPADDRYRLSLLLVAVDGRAAPRLVPVAKQRPAGEFRLARLLGCDGRTVWFGFDGIRGVDLASGRLVGAAELRAANRGLDEAWDDPRRMAFDGALRLVSDDRRTTLEVDAATLVARPVSVAPRPPMLALEPAVSDFLCLGVHPSASEWLGLHTALEAEHDLKPGSWLSRDGRPDDTKQPRRLYRGTLGPPGARGQRAILAMAAVNEQGYLNAAFLRAGLRAEALRLAEPDGFLMIYTARPSLGGTTVVARLDAAGRPAWTTDTGINRFKLDQILPDARRPAFIGTRPAVPGKVSEPILVIVDTQSGQAATTTLWQ